MNLKKDDVYICKEPYCRAEIVVRRGADSTCHGNFNIRCCCGKDMVLEKEPAHSEMAATAKRA